MRFTRFAVFAALVVALFLLAGCTNAPAPQAQTRGQSANSTPPAAHGTPAANQTAPATPPAPVQAQNSSSRCPASCDDANACTQDVCNQQTDFECRHIPITPCCGNGVCETGENSSSCPQDCTTENSALQQLIANTARVNSYSYAYQKSVNGTIVDSYAVRRAANLTLLTFDHLQHRGTFSYNNVLVNATGNYSVLYCENMCGPQTPGMTIAGTSEFAQKTPVEILQSLPDPVVTGTENVQNKPSTILQQKEADGYVLTLKAYTFYGVPLVIETSAPDGSLVSQVRYVGMNVNSVNPGDIQLPHGITFNVVLARTSLAYWQTRDVAISDATISENGAARFTFQNNLNSAVTVTHATINGVEVSSGSENIAPGSTISLSGTIGACTAGQQASYTVTITYTNIATGSSSTESGQTLDGTC